MGLCFSLMTAARGDVLSSVRVFRASRSEFNARVCASPASASSRVSPRDRTEPPEDARWPRARRGIQPTGRLASRPRRAHRYETTRARRAVRFHVPRRSVARGPPRLRSQANGSGGKLANRDSARDSRSPETKRAPTVAASAREDEKDRHSKKRFPTDASSNDASRYRRLTATLLSPRASRLPSPSAFIPDDDARRTPRPGSTRRARKAKSGRPTRMTTKNPETVWRRFKPLDARRSRSRNRKPTASTRASAISTSRVTRGHRFSRAS